MEQKRKDFTSGTGEVITNEKTNFLTTSINESQQKINNNLEEKLANLVLNIPNKENSVVSNSVSKKNTTIPKLNKTIINSREIKENSRIEEVISRYVSLNDNNKGLCPFHNEKTPSFSVEPDRQIFKCFGCGQGGDIYTFIMNLENLTFPNAIKRVADLTGQTVKYDNLTKEEQRILELRDNLDKGHLRANDFYIKSLHNDKTALDYLLNRGFTEELLLKYKIGYAPNYCLKDILKCYEGVNEDTLVDNKVLNRSKNGENLYPLNYKRIMFPIIKNRRIIGFQGRAIEKGINPKYLTASKDFFIWNSDCIEKNKEVIVFEGIPDALTSLLAGFDNTVALLGTQALNSEGMNVLEKADQLYFFLDNDDSGKMAMEKYGKIFGNKAKLITFNLSLLGIEEEDYTLSEEEIENERIKESTRKLHPNWEGNPSLENLKSSEDVLKKHKLKNRIKDINGIYQHLLELDKSSALDKLRSFIEQSLKNSKTLIELQKAERIEKATIEFEEGYKEWLEIEDVVAKANEYELKEIVRLAHRRYEGNDTGLTVFIREDLQKNSKVPLRMLNALVKEVKTEEEIERLKRESDETVIQKNSLGFALKSILPQHRDFLIPQSYTIFEGGVLKEQVTPRGEMTSIRVANEPVYISGVFVDLDTKKEQLEVTFRRMGEWKSIITERENVLRKTMIEKLINLGLPVNSENSGLLVKYLADFESLNIRRIECKKSTNRLGWHENNFVTEKGVITKKGLDTESDVVFSTSVGNAPFTKFEIKETSQEEWVELTKFILPRVFQLNQSKIMIPIMSWFMTTFLAPFIREKEENKFPILNMWGIQGCGKTTLATILNEMFGVTSNISTINNTYFSLLKAMSETNAIPLILDEYKIADLNNSKRKVTNIEVLTLVKNVFDCKRETRGRANQSVVEYILSSPLCVIGEDYFSGEGSDATRERSIIVTLEKKWVLNNRYTTSEVINELNQVDLGKFAYGYILLIHQIINEGHFENILKNSKIKAKDFTKRQKGKLNPRHEYSIMIMYFGIEMLRIIYDIIGLELPFNQEMIEEGFRYSMFIALDEKTSDTSLDKAIRYIAYNKNIQYVIGEGSFRYEVEKSLLFVEKNRMIENLEIQRHEKGADLPTKQALNNYIKEFYESGDGYVVGDNQVKWLNGRSARCLVIDTKKLEEITGIDESTWLQFATDDELDKLDITPQNNVIDFGR